MHRRLPLFAFLIFSPLLAQEMDSFFEELYPLEIHSDISSRIVRITEGLHYERVDIDNSLSSEILDRYLDNLDGSRYYFLSSDVSSFSRFRFEIDNLSRNGDTSPAFEIFNLYQARVDDRIDFALSLLENEIDFSTDESFVFDRDNSNWPRNITESNELWRKRVKNDALNLTLIGETWEEIRETLSARYERIRNGAHDVTEAEIFELYINSMMRSVDPHSTYFTPRNSEEYRIQMSLSYQGIGATLQLNEDMVTISDITPGGPAFRSGLLFTQDRIIGVSQSIDDDPVDVIGWELDDVVQLIRGPRGTDVTLHILRAGSLQGAAPDVITITRDEIKLEEQAAKSSILEINNLDSVIKIGVITVPSFYQDFDARSEGEDDYTSTTRDVARLVGELQLEGIDGLVIDLRNNGGGHLSEATSLTGLFIDEGPIVQIKERRGPANVLGDPSRGTIYSGPLAVLVNRYSASASEIFAGAIQDYGRGIVVGQQTYGKGTVQNMFNLDQFSRNDDYGQLTLTIGKYYRITGESTQHRGVLPDITLPSAIDSSVIGESSSTAALPWDQIPGTRFRKSQDLTNVISVLRQNHNLRMLSDPDLVYFQSNVDASINNQSLSEVTLNRDERQHDRDDQDQDRLNRFNHWRSINGYDQVASVDLITPDAIPDFNLNETGQILADFISATDNNFRVSLGDTPQS
jgi:carboxyl-terminal processing protease